MPSCPLCRSKIVSYSVRSPTPASYKRYLSIDTANARVERLGIGVHALHLRDDHGWLVFGIYVNNDPIQLFRKAFEAAVDDQHVQDLQQAFERALCSCIRSPNSGDDHGDRGDHEDLLQDDSSDEYMFRDLQSQAAAPSTVVQFSDDSDHSDDDQTPEDRGNANTMAHGADSSYDAIWREMMRFMQAEEEEEERRIAFAHMSRRTHVAHTSRLLQTLASIPFAFHASGAHRPRPTTRGPQEPLCTRGAACCCIS